MEFLSFLAKVNFWAVILAAISYLIIGSLWYSPLMFGNQWIKLKGFTEKDFKSTRPMWLIMVLTFFSSALAATVISFFLGANSNPVFGAIIGAGIAVFWISTSKLSNVLYENQPTNLFLIHAGFDITAYLTMGLILGFWR